MDYNKYDFFKEKKVLEKIVNIKNIIIRNKLYLLSNYLLLIKIKNIIQVKIIKEKIK